MAGKSQVNRTIAGEKIRGVGISITQILKNVSSIENFIFFLKEFKDFIPIDLEIDKEIDSIIQNFSSLYTFFLKYEKIFDKFGFSSKISM